MKKKVLLGIAALGLLGMAGTAATGLLSRAPALGTQAEVDGVNINYYFRLQNGSNNWLSDSAKVYVWAWNSSNAGNTSAWHNVDISGSVATCAIPATKDRAILVRMPSSAAGPDWDTKLNQSNELTLKQQQVDCYKVASDNFDWFVTDGLYKTDTINLYFICDGKWGQAYAHIYDSPFQEFGDWPGAVMDRNGAVVSFAGSSADAKAVGNLWKVTVKSDYAANVIFNNNDKAQTPAFVPTNDGIYHYGLSAGSEGDTTTGLADAVKWIYDFETARNAVAAGGGIKAYSICGLVNSTGAGLISRYNKLSTEAKAFVDGSATNTYKKTGEGNDNILFSDIVSELTYRLGRADVEIPASLNASAMNDGNSTLAITIVSVAAALSVGAFFFIAKKRKQEAE